jgi:hypothetical protein
MGKIAHHKPVFRTKTGFTIRITEYIIRNTYTKFCFLKKVDLWRILWDGKVKLSDNLFDVHSDLGAVF